MLDAGDELAVAGVNLDDLALVEVHGDLDDSAGVDRGRLGGTLDGVALKARVGLDDSGLNEHRRGHAHELIVGEEQLADVVLAQPLGVLAHHVLGRNQYKHHHLLHHLYLFSLKDGMICHFSIAMLSEMCGFCLY